MNDSRWVIFLEVAIAPTRIGRRTHSRNVGRLIPDRDNPKPMFVASSNGATQVSRCLCNGANGQKRAQIP
jgi:hypothetical protein